MRPALKVILLEIGFTEKMRTTWGGQKVPQVFLPNFLIRENTI